MRSRLAFFAVLIISLGLVQPAHAAGPSAVPIVNVGDHVDLESGWANLVDVDVNGSWDNGETGYKTDNIFCRREP